MFIQFWGVLEQIDHLNIDQFREFLAHEFTLRETFSIITNLL